MISRSAVAKLSVDAWSCQSTSLGKDQQEYFDAALPLIKSTLSESERRVALLGHYLRMRELSHEADIQLAKLSQHLTIEIALHDARLKD